jgi:hypothetical protein
MSPPFCLWKGPRVELPPDPDHPGCRPWTHVVCLKSPGHDGAHLCFAPLSIRFEFAVNGATNVWLGDRTPCWVVDDDGEPVTHATLRLFAHGPIVVFGPEPLPPPDH